ncbi:MAG: DUF1570 domain-containing protein [Phycisphaera sp.]|nr:DUF1570 domain-containing protein [Phycisphaera sp.]
MRMVFMLILVVFGGARFIESPTTTAPAGPPIEIRLDGGHDEARELRIREIEADFPKMRRHRTSRFEILSDLGDDVVASHGQLLERTVHAVHDFCEALGYQDIDDLKRMSNDRHFVIAFGNREDFVRFAGTYDKVNALWLGGYFSPGSGHLVYHSAADHPNVRRVTSEIGEADELSGALDPHHELRGEIDRFVVRADASVVVHEATHMLLHQIDVAPATSMQPMWLLEGLAGSFEPVEATRRFGPLRRENGRTRDFRKLLEDDEVPSLVELVSVAEFPKEPRTINRHYAASAALCSWLARHRPKDFRRYIDVAGADEFLVSGANSVGSVADAPQIAGMPAPRVIEAGSTPGSSAESKRRRLASFERIFGDLEEFERAWLRSERVAASMPIADAELVESWD